MRFWARIVQNSAAALTVSGTFLALGIALGALGLSEVRRGVSPWGNGWVRLGFAVGVVAVVSILSVFIAAMVMMRKRDRFLDCLGRSLYIGTRLLDVNRENLSTFEELSAEWTRMTADLIESGVGVAENERFLSSPRLIGEWVTGAPTMRAHSDQLNRLADLIARPGPVNLDFDHRREWFWS